MNTDTINPTTTQSRRWFRFRLRTLLIMVAVLSVPLGWIGRELDQRRRENVVVAWVEEMGGIANFGKFPFGTTGHPLVESSRWEKTTEKWFGKRVGFVSLTSTSVSDLSPLAELKYLEVIFLNDIQVGDLTTLAGLNNLRLIDLVHTQISQEQLKEIRLALPKCTIAIRDKKFGRYKRN